MILAVWYVGGNNIKNSVRLTNSPLLPKTWLPKIRSVKLEYA